MVREFGMDTYTHLCLKWITHKDLPCHTGNSARCSGAGWMGVALGAGWTQVYAYGGVPSLFTLNYHNIVNRLYPNANKIFF